MTHEELNARLGAIIRRKRVLLGMSQDALGKRLAVSFQQIQKYENGSNQLSVVRLVEMAEALGCTAGDILASAQSGVPVGPHGESDRATLELMKRLEKLEPNQLRGVRLLVRALAGEVA